MFDNINSNVEILFNNKIFLGLIKVLLIYYIIFISFKLNNELIVLFDNQLIKILIVLLIFYSSIYNIEISILIMLSFIFSLNTLNKIKMNDLLNLDEDINNLETETEIEK